jgi:adenine-specific DNA methylase
MEQQETYDRRLIEEIFPVKDVSEESAKEKSIRHGHISTLHIWWARRPLAASRGTSYAALVKVSSQNLLDLEKKDNSSRRSQNGRIHLITSYSIKQEMIYLNQTVGALR